MDALPKVFDEFFASPVYMPPCTIPNLLQLVEVGTPFFFKISSNAFQNHSTLNSDNHPNVCNKKPFQFVAHPSSKHLEDREQQSHQLQDPQVCEGPKSRI